MGRGVVLVQPPRLATQRQQVLGAAILAAHPHEARLQHAAVEVAPHHRVDHSPPATMLALEVVLVAAAEALEVVRQHSVQR